MLEGGPDSDPGSLMPKFRAMVYGSSSNLRKLWVVLDICFKTVLRILVRIRYPVLCRIRDEEKKSGSGMRGEHFTIICLRA
jgi:hypothetical protein